MKRCRVCLPENSVFLGRNTKFVAVYKCKLCGRVFTRPLYMKIEYVDDKKIAGEINEYNRNNNKQVV